MRQTCHVNDSLAVFKYADKKFKEIGQKINYNKSQVTYFGPYDSSEIEQQLGFLELL